MYNNNLRYRNRNNLINSYLNNITNNTRQINSILEIMKNNENMLSQLINEDLNINNNEFFIS